MAKFTTLKVLTTDLEALEDAVSTGEGYAVAAAAIVASPRQEVTIFDSRFDQVSYRVDSGYPVSIMFPVLTSDGDLSIPVRLKWYHDEKLTELRGPVEQGALLVEKLVEVLP